MPETHTDITYYNGAVGKPSAVTLTRTFVPSGGQDFVFNCGKRIFHIAVITEFTDKFRFCFSAFAITFFGISFPNTLVYFAILFSFQIFFSLTVDKR